MDEILKRIKKNRKTSSLQNKKDYYQLGQYQQLRGKVQEISKDVRWATNRTYKYYDGENFEGLTPRQLTKMKANNFDLIVKGRQLSRREALLENTSVEVEISCDQEDWFNSLEEELTQVQEDLNFYDNILGEFTADDIVSLGLDSRGDTTQESSAVMTTADAVATADITANAVILDDASVANDSYAWRSDRYE